MAINPRFTVPIPTTDRAEYLVSTLRTSISAMCAVASASVILHGNITRGVHKTGAQDAERVQRRQKVLAPGEPAQAGR